MVQSSVMRLYGVVGAAMVMVTAGCTCQQPQDECDTITAVFSSPVDGATVNPTLDLEFRANNNVGNGAALSSATIAVKPEGAAAFGAEQDASLAFNKAIVTGLVLTPGKNEIRATLNTASPVCTGKTATITVTARTTSIAPKVSAVSFPQDLNDDGVLNASELPTGTNLKMAVTATDTTSSTIVRALSGATAVSVADVSFSAGKATVEIPVLSNSGTFDLFAQLASAGVAINTAIDNPEALGSIRVERASPTCAITTKDTLGPTDDVLVGEPTFGLRATGTLGMTAVTSSLQLDTATPVTVSAVNGNVSTDFAVPQTGDTTYTLRLVATDALGNVCTATKLVRVDLQAPVVSLTLPLAADGGTNISTTPIDVTVSATGAADGDSACLYRALGAAPRQLVGCETLANGTTVIEASFASDGAYTMTAEVQDAAGNTGSASKVANVTLTVCGLSFATISGRPAQCPAFVTQLTSGAFDVTLTTSPTCVGGSISLSLDDVLVATNTTGAFSVPVSNGTHTLVGKIPTSTGSADFTTVSCDVEVNTNAAPVFVNPSASSQVTLSQAVDLQPLNAGAQYPLEFIATVPGTGRIEVCANTSDAAIVGASAAACSDGATGWFVYRGQADVSSPNAAFTYAEGAYTLHLVLVAPGGATATSADLSLIVDVTAPCVSAAGVVLPQDVNTNNQLNAAEVGAGAAQVVFSLDLACGAAASAQVKSAAGADVYSAVLPNPASPLTVDLTGTGTTAALDVFIELIDAVGNKSVATTADGRRAFSIDLDSPVVTLTIPLSADGGMNDITTTPIDTTLAATGVPDGTGACLYRQQGTDPRQLVGCEPLTGGVATVAVSFAGDGAYTLIGEVIDSAANVGSVAKPVNVALTICGLSFATISGRPAHCPAFITALTNGQFSTTLVTSPSCAGATMSLALDGTDVGSNTNGTFAVAVTNGLHTLEGRIPTFNGSSAFTRVSCEIEVNTNAFPVFTSPPTNATVILNQGQDVQPGTPGAQRNLSFTATLPNMGRVEVCTNDATAAGIGATACSDGASGWLVYQGKTSITSPDPLFTFVEGTYSLRLVVVGSGGVAVASNPDLSVIVDVTAPCVAAPGVTLPQDANTDDRLNSAELASAAPRVAFAIDPACGTVNTAQITSAVGSTVYSASVANPTSPVTIDLTGVTSTANLDVFVTLIDAVGNRTTATTPNGRKAFTVDRDAPVCTVAQPNKTTLNIADAPGGLLAVQIQTSSDVTSVPVTLGAGAPVSATVSAPTYVASTSIAISGTQTQTLAATCTDAAGNQATASVSLTYDLDAPTCAFSAPAANSVSTSNDITTTVTVGGAEGRTVRILSSAQPADIGSLTVSGGTATGLVTGYPNGLNQTLTALVSDSAGNSCTATVSGISVNSTTCNLTTNAYANGATLWVNAAAATGSGSTRTANIVATSSNCTMLETVTLSRTAPTSAVLGTGQTNSSGVVSFTSVSLTDADVLSVSIDNGAGGLTTRSITVDFTAPAVTGTTINGTTSPATSLFFVAPGTGVSAQNRQVQLGTAGYFPDSDSVAPGAQLSVAVNGVTGGAQGAAKGSVSIIHNLDTKATVEITQASESFAAISATLAHDASGPFVIRVTDQANNSFDAYAQTATVDVIAPNRPANVVAATGDRHLASVTLDWDPTGDDEASGTVRDYDVRWTTGSINLNNKMATEANYFSSSSQRESPVTPGAPHFTQTYRLPAHNFHYIAVRARDEVDNYSAFLAPLELDSRWTQQTLSVTGASSFGSTVLSEGNLNNDAGVDLVVAASTGSIPGAVYVFYGGTAFASKTTCVAPDCTTITAPPSILTDGGVAPAGLGFGFDVSARGNIGDTASEALSDLVVAQQNWPDSSGPGRVFIYFGTNAGTLDTSAPIEIRGALTPTQIRIGYTAKIIKNIDGVDGNGKAWDDLVIAAPFYSGIAANQGRVYIFKGRSAADWAAARTGVDNTTVPATTYVPITSADYVIDGTAGALSSGQFGRPRWSVSSIGDYDGDGFEEFTVGLGAKYTGAPQNALLNKLNMYRTSPSPAFSKQLGMPCGGANCTDVNPLNGFGASIVGATNLLGTGTKDMLVSWSAIAPTAGVLYIFTNLDTATTPSVTIESETGTTGFGSATNVAQLNTGDTYPDILVGQEITADANAYILWNQAGAFPTTIGTSSVQIWVTRFNGNAIVGASTQSLGRQNAVGDLSGDGYIDVTLADARNNVVYVWK